MPSYTLASVWAGRPHWIFHHMAMGDVRWNPSSEPVVGYSIYRSSTAAGPFIRLNPANLVTSTNYTVPACWLGMTKAPPRMSSVHSCFVCAASRRPIWSKTRGIRNRWWQKEKNRPTIKVGLMCRKN